MITAVINNSILLILMMITFGSCQNEPKRVKQSLNPPVKKHFDIIQLSQKNSITLQKKCRRVLFYKKKKFVDTICDLIQPFKRGVHKGDIIVIRKSSKVKSIKHYFVGDYHKNDDSPKLFKQQDDNDAPDAELHYYEFNQNKKLFFLDFFSLGHNDTHYFHYSDSLYSDTLVITKGYYRANFFTYYIVWSNQTKHFHLVKQERNSYSGGYPYHYKCISKTNIMLNDTVSMFDTGHEFTNNQCFEVWAANEINDMRTGVPNWQPKIPYLYKDKQGKMTWIKRKSDFGKIKKNDEAR